MFTDRRRFLLIANGSPPSKEVFNSHYSSDVTLVAIDGGVHTALLYGATPAAVLGDFDSAPPSFLDTLSQVERVGLPDQNQTDLEKGIHYLFEQGAEILTILGAFGSRLDHTIKNFSLLALYPNRIKMVSDTEECFALLPQTELLCPIGQSLSLLPIGSVKGLCTEGLKWNLDQAVLETPAISNVTTQERITISFLSGSLVCCLNQSI